MVSPWLAGFVGWLVGGGPGGALLGVAIALLWNRANASAPPPPPGGARARRPAADASEAPGIFAVALMSLVAAVMKADGRASKSELAYVKEFLRNNFSREFAQAALKALQALLQAEPRDVEETCRRLAGELDYPQRLELLHLLHGVAWADGELAPGEERLLARIATSLGVRAADAASIAAMFRRRNAEARAAEDAEDDYRILGIGRDASDEEVRKAYRRMAMKYHPDKVSHLGPEFQRDATVKFRRVHEAYERIKRARAAAK